MDGRRTYYLRRRVAGKLVQVKTTATAERSAFEQLKRWEADPGSFSSAGEPEKQAVHLDQALATEFLAWSKRPRKDDVAGNTLRWVTQQCLYLATWGEQVKGVDLRRADLARDILLALKACTCRPQRIVVLKRIYSWLRKVEHRIEAGEDPTRTTLAVPQYEPAQQAKSKARTKAEISKVRRNLSER